MIIHLLRKVDHQNQVDEEKTTKAKIIMEEMVGEDIMIEIEIEIERGKLVPIQVQVEVGIEIMKETGLMIEMDVQKVMAMNVDKVEREKRVGREGAEDIKIEIKEKIIETILRQNLHDEENPCVKTVRKKKTQKEGKTNYKN